MAPEKTHCPIVAFTDRHRVEGDLVLLKGERLSDKLNVAERRFEPILDARVYALDGGKLLHQASCLALNKERISMMLPKEEVP